MAKGLGSADYALLLFGTLGALLCCVSTAALPMRRAQPAMGINWPERRYYVLKVTDKSMAPVVTWKTLETEICQKYKLYQAKYGNAAAQMGSKMMTKGLGSLGMGGAAAMMKQASCGMKKTCRQHVSERCIWYGYMAFDGMVLMMTNALSLCCIGLAGFCLMISNRPTWKWYAMLCCGMAAFLSGCGFANWINDSNAMILDMQRETIWPYAPMNEKGAKAEAAGIGMMFLATAAGFIASQPESKAPAFSEADLLAAGMPPPM